MKSLLASLGLVLVLLLAGLSSASTSAPGASADPSDDQEATGPAYLLQGTPARCHDPVFDVVASNVSLTATDVTVAVTFDDLAGAAACGPVPLAITGRIGIVHLYFNYSALGWPGSSGHYVYWQHDASGGLCAGIYSPVHGSTPGCVGGLGSASLSGNTLTWSMPRAGTFASATGTTSYRLEEPLEYYGVAYSDYALGELKDQYAW